MEFIREYADRREVGGPQWGVEPICAVLTEHGLPIARVEVLRAGEPVGHGA